MTIPRWDISQLVDSTDTKHLKEQMRAMRDEASAFASRYRGKIADLDASGLREMLAAKDEMALRYEGAMTYTSLSFAADTTDPVANDLYAAYSEASTQANQDLAFMSIEVGRLLASRPEMLDDPELKDYRHYLERMLAYAPYLLSEGEEKVIMAKDQNGVEAWSKLQSRWLSTRQFRMNVNGEEKVLSVGEMTPFIYDPDRTTRKNVYLSLGETLVKDEILWADIMKAIVTDHQAMGRIRGYPSPLTSSLLVNDVEQGAVEALMRVVRRNSGLCQRYFRLKAGLLGLPILGSWDLRAPLPGAPEHQYSWEETRDLLVSVYSGYDARFGEWVADIYKGQRLDGQVRKGKRTGAFCDTWIGGRSAFILSSYSGRLNDVYTLAHELGHGVHAYLYTRAQNPSNCQVSLCVAECGSLFGELLLTERLLEEAGSGEERRALLVKVLNSFTQTVFQEGFRYLFEISLYDALDRGELLDSGKISELWMAAQKSIYGDAVEYLPESKYDWARFPHHFFPDLRFYDYPYVFAQLFVFALFRLYKGEGEAFKPKFRRLLEAGSSRSPADLARELGFDISEEGFWLKGMEQAEEFLAELERSA